jgi:hypothetical protein
MGRVVVEEAEHPLNSDDTPFAMGDPLRYSITKEFAGATVLVTGETQAVGDM